MFRLVSQRRSSDCMTCCLSMLLGVPYRELVGRHHALQDAAQWDCGLHSDDAVDILNKEGRQSFVIHSFSPALGPCIVVVPSLNNPGYTHGVVWTGNAVKDPSTKKKLSAIGSVQRVIVSVKDEVALSLARVEARQLLEHLL